MAGEMPSVSMLFNLKSSQVQGHTISAIGPKCMLISSDYLLCHCMLEIRFACMLHWVLTSQYPVQSQLLMLCISLRKLCRWPVNFQTSSSWYTKSVISQNFNSRRKKRAVPFNIFRDKYPALRSNILISLLALAARISFT